LPDSSWDNIPKLGTNIPIDHKITKWPQTIPNYRMQDIRETYGRFPFQGHAKYTQIGIFGMKIYCLATLIMAAYQPALSANICCYFGS
jgi:hypothetical protein